MVSVHGTSSVLWMVAVQPDTYTSLSYKWHAHIHCNCMLQSSHSSNMCANTKQSGLFETYFEWTWDPHSKIHNFQNISRHDFHCFLYVPVWVERVHCRARWCRPETVKRLFHSTIRENCLKNWKIPYFLWQRKFLKILLNKWLLKNGIVQID